MSTVFEVMDRIITTIGMIALMGSGIVFFVGLVLSPFIKSNK
jgi:hypothetical protein